ncbi:hypothetical protein [Sphingomonas xanthus]|uniref:DUF1579 domain-containing protein n=1 Tax=Sphingomonas xanthus TaxID=2594473 RepID=A0A516IP29_9SPHN|nr:hypothetical protein [Sphingomonas xanthus]QDP18639.1 hypothetical protein FMM02_00870 [Sphingomonas xanthus]
MFTAILPVLLQAAQPAACTAPEHRQFDFWVGRWSVTPTGKMNVVAESLIEKLYGGCVIRENWMPLTGTPGGSLNNFIDGRWHQTWVDSANSRVEFSGGFVDGRMVLLGYWKGVNGPGKDALIRMTYTQGSDGSVRQHGEQSTDHGHSWSTSFDFTYRPKDR